MMLLRWWDGLWMGQLDDPFIYIPRQDPLLWIMQWLGIPELAKFGYVWDLSLIGCFIWLIINGYQRSSLKLPAVCTLIIFSAYLLIQFAYPTLSIRKYLGIAVFPILFVVHTAWQKDIWELLRYWLFFKFVSAALWKLGRGSLWHQGHMTSILQGQHTLTVTHFPNAVQTKIGLWLLNYPTGLDVLYITAFTLQLTFAIGFITKKADKILLLAMIVFILTDYLLMWIGYWEFLVFVPLLWYTGLTQKQVA